MQDSGEELKLGLERPGFSLQLAREPGDLLKGPFLGFLPALCLVPIAVWFFVVCCFLIFRKTATQMTHGSLGYACF